LSMPCEALSKEISSSILLLQYTRRTRIAQSSVLPLVADEPASPLGDDSQEASIATVSIPTGSGVVSTASPTIPTASPVSTTYTKRKGKEIVVESKTPKKKKVQEQIDVQLARELEEEMDCDAQRMNEQIARDAEIARIHAEEELQMLIDGLDMNNETIAKYLREYYQFATELPIERRIELISDLGMTLEEIKEKFDPVWKQWQDFIPIGSKEEVERFKRKGLRLEQENLVPVEEIYVEALQVKHPIIDWKHLDREDLNQLWELVKETLSIRPATSDKEMEIRVELKRLYKPDVEDQLWTHTQNLMHAPVEWKLYDTCGVHHVTSKDKEIFMLIEKDYPLRKGLAIGMISYKLQVENYSQMANDLILKIYKIISSPRQQDD
nr:hypothetical protein [Tanacetum cinerariifolium]